MDRCVQKLRYHDESELIGETLTTPIVSLLFQRYVQGELTVGALGRAHTFDAVAGQDGFGTVHSVAFSKGAFVGLSVEGSVVGARKKVNEQFYGSGVTSKDILNGSVPVPADKDTVLNEVYAKLKTLSTSSAVSKPPASAFSGGGTEEQKESVEG